MNIEVTKDLVKILKDSNLPNENEYNITKCYFNFDDFTNSFQVKRAIFTIISTGEMFETDIINDECYVPIDVLKREYEKIKLGVYGYNIDDNDDLLNRFSPSYAEFVVPTGSYEEGALSPEIITPTQYDLYSQALQEGLDKVDDKIEEVDNKIEEIDEKIIEVNTAIDEANNININIDKVGKVATVDLTKKDGTHKTVNIRDGYDLDYDWNGTELGVKREDEVEYEYVDLKGEKGDCYFATFEIEDGKLLMSKPDDMTQIDFRIDNGGHLLVEVTV